MTIIYFLINSTNIYQYEYLVINQLWYIRMKWLFNIFSIIHLIYNTFTHLNYIVINSKIEHIYLIEIIIQALPTPDFLSSLNRSLTLFITQTSPVTTPSYHSFLSSHLTNGSKSWCRTARFLGTNLHSTQSITAHKTISASTLGLWSWWEMWLSPDNSYTSLFSFRQVVFTATGGECCWNSSCRWAVRLPSRLRSVFRWPLTNNALASIWSTDESSPFCHSHTFGRFSLKLFASFYALWKE